jgi:OmpA family protein
MDVHRFIIGSRLGAETPLRSVVAASAIVVVLLGGCATVPSGPSVMVLPGTGKTFEQFQADDVVCRQFASRSVETTPGKAATETAIGGAATGTVLGAAAGALIGAASGSPATGAAVGAGLGLLGGTAVGAGRGDAYYTSVQGRYDIAYRQCMYAKGHQVPW